MTAEIKNFRENSEGQWGILQVIYLIIKSRRILMSFFFAGFAISVVAYLLTPKNFTAVITFVSFQGSPFAPSMANRLSEAGLGSSASLLNFGSVSNNSIYLAFIRSDRVMDKITERLHLVERYHVKQRESVRNILSKNTITKDEKGGVLRLTYVDTDPERAAEIANTYFDVLNESLNSISLTQAQKEANFLEKRVDVIKQELSLAEDSITNFQVEHQVIVPRSQVEADFALARRLDESLLNERMNYNNLSRVERDGAPDLVRIQENMRLLEKQRERLLRGMTTSTGDKNSPLLSNTPKLLEDYNRLARQVALKESLYDIVLKQFEMARATAEKEKMEVQAIDRAETPKFASSPRKDIYALVGSFLGIVLGLFFILLSEAWKNLVRNPETAETALKIQDELPLPNILKRRRS